MSTTITVSHPRAGVALVSLAGEVDVAVVERLETVLAGAARCAEVVIEAAAVDFIDCAGLRPLLMAARTARARGGAMCVRAPSPALAQLITWCGLEEELVTCPTQRRAGAAGAQG